MRILGIETSCDETAVCLIEASGGAEAGLPRVDGVKAGFSYKALGNALISQAALHAQYGGVYPNLAKREHGKNLVPLLTETLSQAGALVSTQVPTAGASLLPLKELLAREEELFKALLPFLLKHERPQLDAIAVTSGPGLEPALWVGINFAKALSLAWDTPLIAVNHMEGHIVMPYMTDGKMQKLEFPLLALLISGGHTELVLSKEFGVYERIGETRDDAAGEAFDKVARLLGLGYPGGPEVSAKAAEARARGSKGDFSFTRPMLSEKNFDFSFSGLKTAVRTLVESREKSDELVLQVCREFEECVSETLVKKTLRAVEEYGARSVVVGGGVSANTYICEELGKALADYDESIRLLTPPPELATDNALMIALAGYFHALKKKYADPATLSAQGNLKLG